LVACTENAVWRMTGGRTLLPLYRRRSTKSKAISVCPGLG
jgi:hypothetical protein